ncbi:MAG: hypothetical protein GY761_08770, partial [Hyphomicrobiales bacterium]|nr:hypothetical protein [Hyphomicrobiales bacterium]
MAEPDNLRIPEIIVCGSNVEVRTQIAASIEKLDDEYLLTNISTYSSSIGDFVSAAVSARILVIALDRQDDFVTYYRKLIKAASVLGVRNIFLVLMNSNNSGGYQCSFQGIKREFDDYIGSLISIGSGQIRGNTLFFINPRVDWYDGKTFADAIAGFQFLIPDQSAAFRLPVSSITETGRPSGVIASGRIQTGDKIVILPSAVRTSVAAMEVAGRPVDDAQCDQSVELGFTTDISAKQGDIICSADDPVEVADQFESTIIWLSEDPMISGRHYDFRSTSNAGDVYITTLKYLINVDLHEHVAANQLQSG